MHDSLTDSVAAAKPEEDLAGLEVVDVLNPGAAAPMLLIGDHAGRGIPAALGDLGLSPAVLRTHIAWDIGVAGLGRALSARLDATFVAQRLSRLVIDCNRDPAHPGSIAEVSDGVVVPGNTGLTEAARDARRRRVFDPYHARIAAELEVRPRLLVSLHSFTPSLADGAHRPWRFGVLHLGDSPASARLLGALRARLDPAQVGDNQPYQMDGTDYTIPRHAVARGHDYVELEVRQDLLATPAQQREVAAFLVAPIAEACRVDPLARR